MRKMEKMPIRKSSEVPWQVLFCRRSRISNGKMSQVLTKPKKPSRKPSSYPSSSRISSPESDNRGKVSSSTGLLVLVRVISQRPSLQKQTAPSSALAAVTWSVNGWVRVKGKTGLLLFYHSGILMYDRQIGKTIIQHGSRKQTLHYFHRRN